MHVIIYPLLKTLRRLESINVSASLKIEVEPFYDPLSEGAVSVYSILFEDPNFNQTEVSIILELSIVTNRPRRGGFAFNPLPDESRGFFPSG